MKYLDDDSQDKVLISGWLRLGFDARSSRDEGNEGLPDEHHLEFAAKNGYVLFTANVADFARIHPEWMHSGQHHAGIVVTQQQAFGTGEQLRRLARIDSELGQAGMVDRLEYLSSWG